MKKLAKTLQSKKRVHYHDCDPMNHLNNSRYIDYIMDTRTEQLLIDYGVDIAELAYKHGIGWVAALTQITYFAPAKWMEVVIIETRLIRYTESSVIVEGIMWDEEKKNMKALLWAKLVHFDIKKQKSNKHNDELMELFNSIQYDTAPTVSFEDRVNQIRQDMKQIHSTNLKHNM